MASAYGPALPSGKYAAFTKLGVSDARYFTGVNANRAAVAIENSRRRVANAAIAPTLAVKFASSLISTAAPLAPWWRSAGYRRLQCPRAAVHGSRGKGADYSKHPAGDYAGQGPVTRDARS